MDHIKEIIKNVQADRVVALTAGLKFLNENMGGLYPGELTIICGEADSEKSALMIRQISCLAIDKKTPVLMVLNGTDKRTFLACLTAYYCSILTKDVHGLFNDIYYKKVFDAFMSSLKDLPLFIMDVDEFNSMHTDLQPFIEERGIRAIFIEHSNWIFYDEKKQKRLGQTLKQLAVKLNVVVVAEYLLQSSENSSFSNIQIFNKDGIFEFAENVINLFDFTANDIIEDERGYDVRGLLEVKILKHKGELAKNKKIMYQRKRLLGSRNNYVTNFNMDEAKKVIQGNDGVSKLVSALDCELITDYYDEEEI